MKGYALLVLPVLFAMLLAAALFLVNCAEDDSDPTGGRNVYSELEVNPELFVLKYEVSGSEIVPEVGAERITSSSEFRRPGWMAN